MRSAFGRRRRSGEGGRERLLAGGRRVAAQRFLAAIVGMPGRRAGSFLLDFDADETSWRMDKLRAWLWVAVCGSVTVFMVRASRGAVVAKELIGAGFRGVLTTDRWASYGWVDASMRQLCWSHLKRDFKSFLDYGPSARYLGERLLRETRRMFRAWHKVRDGTMTRAEFTLFMKPVRRRILALLEEGQDLPSQKVSGMCKHIFKLQAALFTFVDQERVEPTNNAAERALRFEPPPLLWTG